MCVCVKVVSQGEFGKFPNGKTDDFPTNMNIPTLT